VKPAIKDRIKELKRVKASELLPNPKNWRQHPKAQRDALQGVLDEIGYAGALLVRDTGSGYMIVDGHLRAETTPDALVPVLVLDVTEEEADKLLLTYDPIAAMAEANKDALKALLESVKFDTESLVGALAQLAEENNILLGLPEPGAGGDDFDTAAAAEGPCRVKTGDLWVIGGKHRLMCGDSTKADDVDKCLGGAEPKLMVTDPPYGVEYAGSRRPENSRHTVSGKMLRTEQTEVVNDSRSEWGETFRGEVAYVWHGALHAHIVRGGLEQAGVGERTANRRWADPAFRHRVTELRSEMVSQSLGRMTDGMSEATDVLRQLLTAGTPPTVPWGLLDHCWNWA
jgi:hypothetical protein